MKLHPSQLNLFEQQHLVASDSAVVMPVVHQKENNPDSEQILKDNEEHLKGQCRTVLTALCNGERLTTTTALRYGIGDLRARIRDLIKFNAVSVQKQLIEGKFKEYFLLPDEIKKCKERFDLLNKSKGE